MGRGRNKTSYTSKGERRSSIGIKARDPITRLTNQFDAWKKGKNVVLTIETKDPTQRYQRVNAAQVWGSPFKKVKAKDES